jgi:hypothetical protein
MRTVQMLAAAILLGLAAGYGWSALSTSDPKATVPKAAAVKVASPLDMPGSTSDREWAARAAVEETPAIDLARDDPTMVEQSVTYGGCNDVRAAGKAPLHAGEPGYRTDMDGDGDGIACEPIRRR